MGCNYYLVADPCKICGAPSFRRHIGKSSIGWQFHFRAYPQEGVFTYSDWLLRINNPTFRIIDEYDRPISPEEFKNMVSSKKQCMSPWNIHCQTPMTSAEKAYLRDQDIHSSVFSRWKDNEGHSFSDEEFC